MTFLSAASNLVALTALIGLLFLFISRIGTSVAALSLAAIVLATLSPLGNALLTPLDERFPMWSYPPQQGLEGIIVLCGSYDKVRFSYVSTLVLENDTQPLAMMVDLARRYPAAKILLSGGNDNDTLDGPSSLKKYFVSLGIEPERILTEARSRTTAQNAQFATDLLEPSPSSRWLLVTYGYRMPRAMGVFRKAGFNVTAFPVHLRSNGWDNIWRADGSAAENLWKLDIAAHEWLALLYYKLRGYSDEWFAGPDTNANESKDPIEAAVPAGTL